MAEQQKKTESRSGKKSSSVLASTCSPAASLAPPAPCPKAVAKPEYGVLEQAVGAMVAVAAEKEAVEGLTATLKRWLRCASCAAALKPPISMCGGGHAVCCDCAGANKHCGECVGAAAYTPAACMDGLVGALEFPCPYHAGRPVRVRDVHCLAYHAVAEHKATCGHAPCYCLECTPPFEGSPTSLVGHLTDQSGRHRWAAPEMIEYEAEQRFMLPASETRQLLVAEEDGRVFLLAAGAGRAPAGVRPVNLVCVKGNADSNERPLYLGRLLVVGPEEEGESATLELNETVASCSLPGEVDMAHGRLHVHVNPAMLHGESKEVHLRITISNYY